MTLLLFFAGASSDTPTPTPTPEVPRPYKFQGYEPHQLTLAVFTPARAPFVPRSVFEGNFQRAVNSLQFDVGVNGGFGGASFSFTDRKRRVEDWLEGGLGRHVEVYNPRQRIIYAGFVNRIKISLGALSAERGPLIDVSNRVSMLYTPLDLSVFPPVQGITRSTTIIEDLTSQAKFGIIERVLNGGTIPDDDADQIQATYLAENAMPETNNAFSAPGALSITIECLGYAEFLRLYVYNQVATASSVTISDKLATILAADPNGIFSTDYSRIAVNNYLTNSYEEGNKDAMTIIQGLLSIGDINDMRHTFGIYAKQQAVYRALPAIIAYQERLSAPKQAVMTLDGEELYPWDVEPGKFLLYNDFQIGRLKPSLDRTDPRIMFVESMSYTAPWGLQLSGGKTDKLPQKLAKWGLGGL